MHNFSKEQGATWKLLLQSTFQEEFTVCSMEVATWEGASGRWQIKTAGGTDLDWINTPDKCEEYIKVRDLDLKGQMQIEFKVEAANDAYVLLQLDTGGLFEVVIGGSDNTKCAFRRERLGYDIAEWHCKFGETVLAGENENSFRLSWQQLGVLQLWRKVIDNLMGGGLEHVQVQNFVMQRDVNPRWHRLLQSPRQEEFKVLSMRVSTGFRGTGQWRIRTPTGTTDAAGYLIEREISIYTQDGIDNAVPVDVNLTDMEQIEFDVRAHYDAYIQLSLANGGMFEVVIGEYDNTRSVIRTQKQGRSVAEFQGSFLSKGSFRSFVLSWKQPGVLELLYRNDMESERLFIEVSEARDTHRWRSWRP